MREIIYDRYSAHHSAHFCATLNALKRCKRRGNALAINAPGIGGDDHREAVAHIKVAD
ncbi:MAG: hypothetical protein WKF84_02860 [Pyrinomonadaceae bacterium]